MAEVSTSKVQSAMVHCLRTNTPMAIGDGTAPSPQGEQGGDLVRSAYGRVDEIATWVFLGDDYFGERGSIMDCQFQVTGFGATRFAATEARDLMLRAVAGIDPGTGTYFFTMPEVRPNPTTNSGFEEDPSPTQIIRRRRNGGMLTVQHRTSEFFAPAYVVITAAVL